MRNVARRALPRVSGLLIATAVIGLGSASAAAAATDTWTGADASSPNWSTADNWQAGTAPVSGDSLTFGQTSCDGGGTGVCYGSLPNPIVDDLGANFQIGELSFDGANTYISAPSSTDSLVLAGNGGSPTNIGLEANTTASNHVIANSTIPLVLGADQQWNISNGGLYTSSVEGSNYTLNLNLTNGDLEVTDGVLNTGQTTLSGYGDLQVDGNSTLPSSLIVNDNTSLTVAGQTAKSGGATPTSGSIAFNSTGNLIVATSQIPETTLTTGAVTLNNASTLEMDIDGNSTTPGADASEIQASTVNFSGGTLALYEHAPSTSSNSCVSLTPGNTYTLVTGSLSGNLSYVDIKGQTHTLAPGGTSAALPVFNECSGTNADAVLTYASGSLTATIASAPVAGATKPAITGTAAVGDTLTASTGAWSGTPDPTYSYQWLANGAAISGANGSTFQLTSAQAGKTITVTVTASNAVGSASATSGGIGPVQNPAAGNGTSTGPGTGGGGSGTPTSNPSTPITPQSTLPTLAQIRFALTHLRHPGNRRAIVALLRHKAFKTRFHAPSGGALRIVWTTRVRIGHGKHSRSRTMVIARAFARPHGTGWSLVTIHLTGAGHRLLMRQRFGLHTTAISRFQPSGGNWTSATRRFKL